LRRLCPRAMSRHSRRTFSNPRILNRLKPLLRFSCRRWCLHQRRLSLVKTQASTRKPLGIFLQ
jgi:hypothetical protein